MAMIENDAGMTPGRAAGWSYGHRYDVPVVAAPPPGAKVYESSTRQQPDTGDTGWHAVMALLLFCLVAGAAGVAAFGWPLP